MAKAPYSGPETSTSLRVLEELLPELPAPAVLLGGWGVYFTVIEGWKRATAQDYFGSRDIDLGFYTPPGESQDKLKEGNLPSTLRYLLAHGFHKHASYQVVRYHAWENNRILTEVEASRMQAYDYYRIVVDLIASHQRDDLAAIAGFQAFSEPLLRHVFEDPNHRVERRIAEHLVWVPAPHVLCATKLTSLPQRTKDDKAIKDLCDLYSIILYSGVPARTLRRRIHEILSDASPKIEASRRSHFVSEAASFLGVDPTVIDGALRQLA